MPDSEASAPDHIPLALEPFAQTVPATVIERTAAALRAHGFEVLLAANQAEARQLVLGLLPAGAEVGQGASTSLAELGLTEVIEESGRYDALSPRLRSMDRRTEGRSMRKLRAAPDYFLSSVQAVSEDGRLVLASFGGSQLGPIASGAGQVILVVGVQKIVPDLAAAFERIEHYSLPREDARLMALRGVKSATNKLLVLNGELAGRIVVILVGESLGD
jgi:hypothetical protein